MGDNYKRSKPKKSGIYGIKNIINNKIYIGSSFGIYERFEDHKFNMKHDKCNRKLQYAFNKYGFDVFEFIILEEVDAKVTTEFIEEKEQYWIDFYDAAGKGGYNVRKIASSNKGVSFEWSKDRLDQQRKLIIDVHGIKCLVYNLDGSFLKLFDSQIEASKFIGCTSLSPMLKSKTGKCKNYIVKPFTENYPLQIPPYKRVMSFKDGYIDKLKERSRKLFTGKIASDEAKKNMSIARINSENVLRIGIIVVDKQNNFIEKYKSIKDAKIKYNTKALNKYLNTGLFNGKGYTLYTDEFVLANKIAINYPIQKAA